MNNKLDKINFEENSVVAILTKPSKTTNKIDLVYDEFNGDDLLLQYSIRQGDKNTYKSTGLFLATIPKGIKSIHFKSQNNVEIWKAE